MPSAYVLHSKERLRSLLGRRIAKNHRSGSLPGRYRDNDLSRRFSAEILRFNSLALVADPAERDRFGPYRRLNFTQFSGVSGQNVVPGATIRYMEN